MVTDGREDNLKLVPIAADHQLVFDAYLGFTAAGYDMANPVGVGSIIRKILDMPFEQLSLKYFRRARIGDGRLNPYWPRASILVTASLLTDVSSLYLDPSTLHDHLANQRNIAPAEKDDSTLQWAIDFPEHAEYLRRGYYRILWMGEKEEWAYPSVEKQTNTKGVCPWRSVMLEGSSSQGRKGPNRLGASPCFFPSESSTPSTRPCGLLVAGCGPALEVHPTGSGLPSRTSEVLCPLLTPPASMPPSLVAPLLCFEALGLEVSPDKNANSSCTAPAFTPQVEPWA